MPNQPKTKAHAIRIPDDVWNRLVRQATTEGRSVSELVRDVLREHAERKER